MSNDETKSAPVNSEARLKLLAVVFFDEKSSLTNEDFQILSYVLSSQTFIHVEFLANKSKQEILEFANGFEPNLLLVECAQSIPDWFDSAFLKQMSITSFFVSKDRLEIEKDANRLNGYDFILTTDQNWIPYDPKVISVPVACQMQQSRDSSGSEFPTIGSIGYGVKQSGFAKLCEQVAGEFDQATIRLNIPSRAEDDGNRERDAVVADCARRLKDTNINLELFDSKLTPNNILEFFSSNDLNIVSFESDHLNCVEQLESALLSTDRPFLVSAGAGFKRVTRLQPAVQFPDISIKTALKRPRNVYQKARASLRSEYVAQVWANALLKAASRYQLLSTIPDRAGLNKILDDKSRAAYSFVIDEMWQHVPEVMKRKIPEANVQQAYVLDSVRRLTTQFHQPRILCVGSYEDTACLSLKKEGYLVEEIDPVLNGDLNDFYLDSKTRLSSYDLVFSTSVLEHVEDHLLFIRQCADLLKPGGVIVLTVDFKEGYQKGDPKPTVDQRLYTSEMIRDELMGVLPDCRLYDKGTWENSAPDFVFEGVEYSFAAIVIEKIDLKYTTSDFKQFDAGNTSAWRQYAAQPASLDNTVLQSSNPFGQATARRYLLPSEIAQLLRVSQTVPELRSHIDLLKIQIEDLIASKESAESLLSQKSAELESLKKEANALLSKPAKLVRSIVKSAIGKPERLE